MNIQTMMIVIGSIAVWVVTMVFAWAGGEWAGRREAEKGKGHALKAAFQDGWEQGFKRKGQKRNELGKFVKAPKTVPVVETIDLIVVTEEPLL